MIRFLILFVFLPIGICYRPFERILSNKSISQNELPDFMEGILSFYETYTIDTIDTIKDNTIFLLIDYKENRFHLFNEHTEHTEHNEYNEYTYYLISEETVRKITTYEEFMGLFQEYKFLYYEYYKYNEYVNHKNHIQKTQEILSIINHVVYI